jgi:hypothetical protein
VLGRGKVQQEAIDEIAALPADSPYRSGVLALFSTLKVMLENRIDREVDETELLMKLIQSPLFVEYMERATNEARTKGLETGHQDVVENILTARFGTLDSELTGIIPNIIKLSPPEFSPLLVNLSRAELLDRFAP